MDNSAGTRRRMWSKPSLHIDKASPSTDSSSVSVSPSMVSAAPTIRYEAHTTPRLPFEHDEPWWAFLVRYRNIQLFLTALGYWVAALLLHAWFTRVSWHRGVVLYKMIGTPPLHDLFHELLPNTQTYRVLPEIGHVLPVLYLAGLMMYHFDQRSLDCFRCFLVSHGTLIAFRAVSFVGTLLPDSSQQCHVSLFVGSCHDLIFSGHVMIMLLCVLLAQHFYYIPPIIRVMIGVDATVVSCMVISSRNHYTVDVVLAVVLTFVVYLAFTRHPFLVSLCVETPVNVLAIPTLFEADQKSGFCGCSRGPAKTTREGYELMTNAEALKRMTEHAHGALRLMGLRPRVVITRPGHRVAPQFSRSGSTGADGVPSDVNGNQPWVPHTHNSQRSSSATDDNSFATAASRTSSARRGSKGSDMPGSHSVDTPGSEIPRVTSAASGGRRTTLAEGGTGGSSSLDAASPLRWPRREFGDAMHHRVSLGSHSSGVDPFIERMATLRERNNSANSDVSGSSEGGSSDRPEATWSTAANDVSDSHSNPSETVAGDEKPLSTTASEPSGIIGAPSISGRRVVEPSPPATRASTSSSSRRGRAHSSMGVAEYEQLLLDAAAGRSRLGPYYVSSQPVVISPDGRVVGFPHMSHYRGEPDLYSEAVDDDGGLYTYDGYAIDPSLRDSIEMSEHVPNRAHLARGISKAYRRLQTSARRLFEWDPVSNLRGWVSGAGAAEESFDEPTGEEQLHVDETAEDTPSHDGNSRRRSNNRRKHL